MFDTLDRHEIGRCGSGTIPRYRPYFRYSMSRIFRPGRCRSGTWQEVTRGEKVRCPWCIFNQIILCRECRGWHVGQFSLDLLWVFVGYILYTYLVSPSKILLHHEISKERILVDFGDGCETENAEVSRFLICFFKVPHMPYNASTRMSNKLFPP